MKFNCPQCSQHIEVGEELAGTQGACPICGTALTIPGSQTVIQPMTVLDKQFANVGCAMIGATVFFPAIVLIVSLFGIAFCRHPEAKRRAMKFATISFAWFAVSMVLFLVMISAATHR
jgi:hypothetical protein